MTDDWVARLLAAIEAEEGAAHGPEHRRGHTDDCDWWGDMPGYCTCDSKDRVLRRCVAGRALFADICALSGKHRSGCASQWTRRCDCGLIAHLDKMLTHLADSYGVAPATEPADRREAP